MQHRDIAYASQPGATPHRQQTLNLYLAHSSAAQPISRPLLVFIHGGLWVDRDKSAYELLGLHWSRALDLHVCVVNYRLSSKSGTGPLHPAHADDVLRALRFLLSAEAQARLAFRSADLLLVGHSCGAHIAGLVALAEQEATLLTAVGDILPVGAVAAALRGCVSIEGIFDCARFASDFPDWRSGVTDAFGPKAELWESPQDYLRAPQAAHTQQREEPAQPISASRQRVQQAVAGKQAKDRRRLLPWLVIHSREDPWVNLPQAEQFVGALHAEQAARAAAAQQQQPQLSSTATAQLPPPPATQLLLVSGAHFEVVERIGAAAADQVTQPLAQFVRACCPAGWTGKA